MSDANVVVTRISIEDSFGVTSSNPVFQELSIVDTPDLGFSPETEISNVLNPNRDINDTFLLNVSADGGLNFELSYQSIDFIMPGIMFNPWIDTNTREGSSQISAVDGVSNTYTISNEDSDFAERMLIQATGFTNDANNGVFVAESGTNETTIAGNNLATETPSDTAKLKQVGFRGTTGDIESTSTGISSTNLDFTTMGIRQWQWIKIGTTNAVNSFDAESNNIFVQITEVPTTNALVLDVPDNWVVESAASKDIQIAISDEITNGVQRTSYTIEREFPDHTDDLGNNTPTFEYNTGMLFNSLEINSAAASLVTANAQLIGRNSEYQTTRLAGATTVPTVQSTSFNSSSNVSEFRFNGESLNNNNLVLDFGVTINNNLTARPGVSFLGAVKVTAGSFNPTGTLETYFDSITTIQRITNQDEFSLLTVYNNDDNQHLMIDQPRLKATAGSIQNVNLNNETTIPLEYATLRDQDRGYALKFAKFEFIE